jgi:hypothetical protein
MHITIDLLPFVISFALIGGMMGIMSIVESIGNISFNRKMYKLWVKQPKKLSETKNCPKCSIPLFPPFCMVNEGLALVREKYYKEKINCYNCDWKEEFIVKYDGYHSGLGYE